MIEITGIRVAPERLDGTDDADLRAVRQAVLMKQ